MESSRHRERKRYCCFYCNTYFYQVDSWQRHNRKHTGVEIECDDCGLMCSDHFELKEHQRSCKSYHVYSQDVYTQGPGEVLRPRHNSNSSRVNENVSVHETPDSTSKQESIPENENVASTTPKPLADISTHQESNSEPESPETSKDLSVNPELEHLIGEDKEHLGNREEEDPETEALIGIDQNEVSQMEKNERNLKASENGIGVDSQIVINVENALNSSKPGSVDDKHVSSYLSQPSPVGSSVVSQGISLDGSEMNKKYQPYFCKNCGARFTRKDSVTRHLKKGTCSGKSAIVCNICGKVFSEMFELQEHFKSEHKNVVFTPTVMHRSILPRSENHETQPPYTHYPTHYIVHDQHMVHVTRPFHQHEQAYRPMPPAIQTMFYGGQSTFGPRPVHPPPAPYEQIMPSRPMELKYSQTNHIGKDITYISNPGKLLVARNDEVSRKREYQDIHHRVDHNHNSDSHKSRKLEMEQHHGKPYLHSPKYVLEKPANHESINLSEYTTNAMNSKQYFNSRFTKKEPSAGKDEPPRAHQCKVCGLEFPRFEYLLTHLRKHKEKNEVEPFDDNVKDHDKRHETREAPKTSLNDSNSSSSDDNDHSMKMNFVMSQSQEKNTVLHSSNQEPMPVVIPQPHYGVHGQQSDRQLTSHDQMYMSQHTPLGNQPEGGPVEAITPGVDGKFRPFICENCGQRFTRKDSLVRHAKKQTCFEEAADLKCQNCDKTFRYHKCLTQHQELVHGIQPTEHKHGSEDDLSESESEKNDDEESNKMGHDDGKKYKEESNYQSAHREHERLSANPEKYQSPAPIKALQLGNRNTTSIQPLPPTELSAPLLIPPKSEEKIKQSDPAAKNQDSNYIGYCMLPRPFQCEYCGDRFAHRHSLKRHVRRHLGIGIPCHDCGKLYRDQSEWRRHQRSIHNRHYEKYEVPSRMSFRDGVDHGLIGVVPNTSEYEHNEEGLSGSENDEELSMVKVSSVKTSADTQPNASTTFSSHLSNFGFHKNKPPADTTMKAESVPVMSKDEKLKPFDFKSHTTGDKDSRKSVLDLYLCSPNSDEGESEKNIVQPKSEI